MMTSLITMHGARYTHVHDHLGLYYCTYVHIYVFSFILTVCYLKLYYPHTGSKIWTMGISYTCTYVWN